MPIPTTSVTYKGKTFVLLTTQQNAVKYLELLDYSEKDEQDQHERVRTCICAWSDRQLFKTDMLGYSQWIPGTACGGLETNLHRQPPEQHPEDDWLYATSIETTGMGVPEERQPTDLVRALVNSVPYGTLDAGMRDANSNMVRFSLARCKVRYMAPTWDVLSDEDAPKAQQMGELTRMIDRKFTFQGENLSVGGGQFLFVNDQFPLLEPPARLSPTMTLTYTQKAVPLLDKTRLLYLGHVNSRAFDVGYGNFPPGTVLLTTIDLLRYRSANGDIVWDYVFNCLYRNNGTDPSGYAKGHSYILRVGKTVAKASVNDWIEVSLDGASHDDFDGNAAKKIYPGGDLNKAFNLPAS